MVQAVHKGLGQDQMVSRVSACRVCVAYVCVHGGCELRGTVLVMDRGTRGGHGRAWVCMRVCACGHSHGVT